MKNVSIINYSIGNIFSIAKAFEKLDCSVIIADEPEHVKSADYLVLPGVGAFGDGMANLNKTGLAEAIKEYVNLGNPFIGICLGMQFLFSQSEEFGINYGLDLIKGEVKKLPSQKNMKIPHIGWAKLFLPEKMFSWKGTLLDGYDSAIDVYFAHSYICCPEDDSLWLSHSVFGDHNFCSCIKKENVIGYQFHPEKSGNVGIKIIQNFLKL
jgi:imidazole glycerol-phosphate synthase subunit HisH